MNVSRTLILLAAAVLSAIAAGQGPGDLVISPTRLLLDEKSRSGDITVVNQSAQTMRYRLSLVEMEMGPDGVLKRVPQSANSAAGILKLSPREIVLEPGASQRIKVAAYFPAGFGDREVRSHLAFEPIGLPHAATPQDGTFRLNLEVRSVVTIPVVARHGKLSATASISDVSADGDTATFKLSRTGDRTIRGDVELWFAPAGGGEKVAIGHVSGLPLYYPNSERTVKVRLTRDVRSLGKGELQVSFTEQDRSRGAATAGATVKLGT